MNNALGEAFFLFLAYSGSCMRPIGEKEKGNKTDTGHEGDTRGRTVRFQKRYCVWNGAMFGFSQLFLTVARSISGSFSWFYNERCLVLDTECA